ncbi:unnamed protein product [Sphagnum troendelagicum]|uniref:Uncharacterized protein n=1 Tax=Sphagnum troendelagicum TaxID=128251 RepID=A0ABP0UZF5_9BRYO
MQLAVALRIPLSRSTSIDRLPAHADRFDWTPRLRDRQSTLRRQLMEVCWRIVSSSHVPRAVSLAQIQLPTLNITTRRGEMDRRRHISSISASMPSGSDNTAADELTEAIKEPQFHSTATPPAGSPPRHVCLEVATFNVHSAAPFEHESMGSKATVQDTNYTGAATREGTEIPKVGAEGQFPVQTRKKITFRMQAPKFVAEHSFGSFTG